MVGRPAHTSAPSGPPLPWYARVFGEALSERSFALLWFALLGMGVSLQMLEVIIGWQVYAVHRSSLDLGWIGLAEFIPMFLLALPAGHLADRYPRRLVFLFALLLQTVVAGGLVAVSLAHVTLLWPFLALALAAGVTMAIGSPASRAMPPTLVPLELLPSAMTLRSISTQGAQVIGPALGGLLYGLFGPAIVYVVAAGATVLAAGCVLAMRNVPAQTQTQTPEPAGGRDLASVMGGIHFIRQTPILFGAILLDLLAVLFGGAVALLPVFARTVLHVGAFGLGVLRSAPAVGAVLSGALLTRRPLGGRAGRTLLIAVATFGASMVVFGLSRSFVISLIALGVSGFADLYSMNIRSTATALVTPDPLRGRVMAVEMVFISASNQLGAFESGLAAFLIGAVPAVLVGGSLTVLIATTWKWLFPALANVDRLDQVRPAPVERTTAEPALI